MGLMIFRVPSKKGAQVGSQSPERHQDLGAVWDKCSMLHRSKPRRLFFSDRCWGRGEGEDISPPQKNMPKKVGATFGDDNDVHDVGDGSCQEKTVQSTYFPRVESHNGLRFDYGSD